MTDIHLGPATRPLKGVIRVPADKSISHRGAILGALAEGVVRVENFLDSATTGATLDCMRMLGAEIEQPGPSTLIIHGRGLHSLREPADVLFCEGSGTTMRLLAGVCAGQDFLSVLDGTAALKRRPMARIIEPLRAMGAAIMARDGDRLPPLAIHGKSPLHGIDYQMPIASAQVKSALLVAGLYADGPTIIREPAPSRDHTERMLSALGVSVERLSPNEVRLTPPSSTFRLPPSPFRLPSDFSSAAFFIVAALLVAGSQICIEAVGLNPTRTGLLDVIARMGGKCKLENQIDKNGEPAGDLVVSSGELKGTVVGGAEIPRMIDEFPVFAIAATQASGETHVRDAAELRAKESDRISSLTEELRRMGAQIEPHVDGFTIAGPTRLRGARVNAHSDHRLAMSLAVAALVAEGETVIEGWECVGDSFPNFAQVLSDLGQGSL